MAVKLKRHRDEVEVVVISVYGPKNVRRRAELWEGLEEMTAAFQGSPMLKGGDLNVTLEVEDRPNNAGGQDPDSEGFWTYISEATATRNGASGLLVYIEEYKWWYPAFSLG